jgi:hypothetical protein
MTRTRTLATALGALAALVTILSATTSATQYNLRDAWFKVSVEGVQTTKWVVDKDAESQCDSSQTGSGSERITFASTRKIKTRAFQLNGGPVYWVTGVSDPAVLPTRGWVRRSGQLTTTPPGVGCEVGDGGGGDYEPPAPDCGRKRIKSLRLRLMFDPLKRERITLSRNDNRRAPEFKNCVMLGEGWPDILSKDDKKRTAGQHLPYDDLFDRRHGKMLVFGRGKVTSNSGGYFYVTKIEWTLTLERIRGK